MSASLSTLVGALGLAGSVEAPALAMRVMDVVPESLKAQIPKDEKAGQ
jgi:TetR/AcrR family transcriptional repressor of nem operon